MNCCLPLAKELLLKNLKRGNALVSPLSLTATAAMLGAGCSGRSIDRILNFVESKSLDELKSKFSKSMSVATTSPGGSSTRVSFVNGAWVDKHFPLKPSYQQCLRDTFQFEPKLTIHDFLNQADEAVRDINSWAELQTNGLIKNVISRGQIDHFTTVILGNALYFKGFWKDKFNTKWTEKRGFYLVNGGKVSVPFMTSSESYLFGSFDDFKVLEIPYQGGKEHENNFCMQLILPHEKDGLQNLLEKFNADSGCLNGHFDKLEMTSLDHLWIPKFKFTYVLDNIKFPFMDEPLELSEMLQVQGEIPLIPNIVQKAFIEVDEDGTEAAAVTVYPCITSAARPQKKRVIKSFVAEHPFVFIIKEETSGLILFIGAVLNPRSRVSIDKLAFQVGE